MTKLKNVSVAQLYRRIELKELEKSIKSELKKIDDAIKAELKESNLSNITYADEGLVVNLKVSERSGLDTAKFKTEEPEKYVYYSKKSEVKTLTVQKA